MDLSKLILNSKSRQQIENYLAQPTHALLLTGKNGIGLDSTAKAIAKQLADNQVIIIQPRLHDKQKTLSININDIHALIDLTRSRRKDKLAIVIENIESMTNDAPQAFLKLLEEPTVNVFYILSSHSVARLPQTILSRVQNIELLPVPESDLDVLFENSVMRLAKDRRTRILFLAAGLPAETLRLIQDEQYYRERVSLFEQAKLFVQGKEYDRLKLTSEIKDRKTAVDLLYSISRIVAMTAPKSKSPLATAQQLQILGQVIDNLNQNGNVRAQLVSIALNL